MSKLNIESSRETNTLPELSPEIETRLNNCIETLERQFAISVSQLETISKAFIKSLDDGLKAEGGQDLAMIPTYITKRPTGKEKGVYFAIDFGGSNIRFCKVTLKGNSHKVEIEMQKHTIPENIKIGSISLITEYLATKMAEFILEVGPDASNRHSYHNQLIKVGFTFSFPLDQISANKGLIIKWNKGFNYPDSIGLDIVQLLHDSFTEKGLNVEIDAVINDTVGTLLSSAYTKPNTLAGIVLGTGTNACYYEKISKIGQIHKESIEDDDTEMIINTEWGNFDPSGEFIKRTKYDEIIDNATDNPKCYTFEKMVSGKYLGEIVRVIIQTLISENLLFRKNPESDIVETPYLLGGAYLKIFEDDDTEDLCNVRKILETEFGFQNVTFKECDIVKRITAIVSTRSAQLSGIALASLCKKRIDLFGSEKLTSSDPLILGVDGSLYNLHSEYRKHLFETFNCLMGENSDKVVITESKDGSSVGAALAAMVQS